MLNGSTFNIRQIYTWLAWKFAGCVPVADPRTVRRRNRLAINKPSWVSVSFFGFGGLGNPATFFQRPRGPVSELASADCGGSRHADSARDSRHGSWFVHVAKICGSFFRRQLESIDAGWSRRGAFDLARASCRNGKCGSVSLCAHHNAQVEFATRRPEYFFRYDGESIDDDRNTGANMQLASVTSR